jgi:antitoxin PrlF
VSIELKATLSVKGQVSLPAEVRRRLGLSQGSVVRFQLSDDGVRLLPAVVDVRSLKGRVARPAKPVSLQDMELAIAERRVRLAQK